MVLYPLIWKSFAAYDSQLGLMKFWLTLYIYAPDACNGRSELGVLSWYNIEQIETLPWPSARPVDAAARTIQQSNIRARRYQCYLMLWNWCYIVQLLQPNTLSRFERHSNAQMTTVSLNTMSTLMTPDVGSESPTSWQPRLQQQASEQRSSRLRPTQQVPKLTVAKQRSKCLKSDSVGSTGSMFARFESEKVGRHFDCALFWVILTGLVKSLFSWTLYIYRLLQYIEGLGT